MYLHKCTIVFSLGFVKFLYLMLCHSFQVKSEENDSQMDNSKLYSPLFGISNAYFLSNQQKSTTSNVDVPNVKLPKDVPNLLTQHPLSPNSILPNFAAFMSNATSPNKSEIGECWLKILAITFTAKLSNLNFLQ